MERVITLELFRDGDLPAGRALHGTGTDHDFSGWLGLLAAIDALLAHDNGQEHHMTAIDTRGVTRGDVLVPGDEGWDAARQAFNLLVDQRPAAIAFPKDAADVAPVVRHARKHGLRVAPQRTGHNAAPLGDLSDTLILRTDRLDEVSIDPVARRARVGGGVKWESVVPAASELGLAALHGSTPDVSVAGYTLGGGMGWYVRKHGLACEHVRAVELVTADGELLRADEDEHPDLLWALRGGGGSFGIVTALEFDLFPVEEVYAGVLFFPLERAAEVLHAWHEWTAEAPDEVTSVGRILQFPPFPEIPEPLRTRSRSSRRSSSARSRRVRRCWRPCASSGRRWTPSPWCPRWGSRSSTWTRRTPSRAPRRARSSAS